MTAATTFSRQNDAGSLVSTVLRKSRTRSRNRLKVMSQRQFSRQHNVAVLEQCGNYSKQCSNNVATLCCAKNPRCESSRVTSP